MIQSLRNAIRQILKNDPTLKLMLDRDKSNSPLVYEDLADAKAKPPYLVWFIIPGTGPSGLYGDPHAMFNEAFQVTSWGRDKQEAWQLADEVFSTLDKVTQDVWDVELTPWSLISFAAVGDFKSLPDRETGFFQVPATYTVNLTRR